MQRLTKMFLFVLGLNLTIIQTSNAQTIFSYMKNIWPDSRYQIHNNGTVTDKYTGLMWKVCSEGQTWSNPSNVATCDGNTATSSETWSSALIYAKDNNSYAGYNDWRLPNVAELRTLLAYDRYSPAINSTIFPNTKTDKDYYTTSPDFTSSSSYSSWNISFNIPEVKTEGGRGAIITTPSTNRDHIRLVRGGS